MPLHALVTVEQPCLLVGAQQLLRSLAGMPSPKERIPSLAHVRGQLCTYMMVLAVGVRVCVVQVSDLGAVLHMVGGTAASFMIFFLPGLLLINAAIVKHAEYQDGVDIEVRQACLQQPRVCPCE